MKTRFHRSLAVGISTLGLIAGAAQADQQILDDLIVQGSLCVGQDCVNGESFGFDTIRLKENNVRIKFQDTSNSSSFPTNDWQITANESGNGGLNKFSIDDIDSGHTPFTIIAAAPSNALYVDAQGDIGLGTSNPVVELHMATGDSPTLRLEQNNSAGFTAQTWDVAGNETNFFVRDSTNGSRIPFKIRPSAPTNSLFIDTDGNIGMGTASPSAALHVVAPTSDVTAALIQGSGVKVLDLQSTDNSSVQYRMQSNSGNRRLVAMNNSSTIETQIIMDNSEIRLSGPTDTGTNIWARINANGIFTQGPTCDPGPCDRTFDATYYTPPSIEEHAEFMWENSYLWGVGPTSPGMAFNLTEKSAGMLHELEVAHIYIEQLHKRLNALEEQVKTE